MYALTLTAGEAQPALVIFILHIHTLQSGGDGLIIVLAPVGKGGVVRYTSKFHHVAHAHIGVSHAVLLHEGDPAGQLLFGDAGNVLSVQGDAASVRATQPREDT